MRLTIERIRALVLLGGGLLIVALVAFLTVGRWKSRFNLREIPKRLGANIQQEANGVTYTQARGGHTLFKIHASKVVQLKQGGRAILHDVQIELYSEDGARVDRIAGDEFEYDQKEGVAKAAGPVEITLMRPDESLAVAPKVAKDRAARERTTPLANAARTASQGEIHVKTSGLTFDQKSGIATTSNRVEFTVTQATGSSEGATFDSELGRLVLNHSVELAVSRGQERVQLRARHAEIERDNLLCRMDGAEGSFRGANATAGKADLLFRADGSAARLDSTEGFSLTTATAARIAAPRGTLDFDERNQPRHGRLEGGATMDSAGNGRVVHGASPTADFAFTPGGLLRHAHLERGVAIHTDETRTSQNGELLKVNRDWRSPVADIEFRDAGRGQVELASVVGSGGVVVTGQTRRGNGPELPSRMVADQVKATFGDRQSLTAAVGTGHASLEQTTNSGSKQITSGDRIEASFVPSTRHGVGNAFPGAAAGTGEAIQSAIVKGNVVLIQQPAAKTGASGQPPLRATAGQAVYEGEGEWLHLLVNPRVESAALQLSADKLDVSQVSGDAFARGDVKATWTGSAANAGAGASPGITLGGQGPAHVVAAEAQLHQATGEATFRGKARLWQQANSISAPVIVLNRAREILTAHGVSAADPVRLVMLSSGGLNTGKTGPGAGRSSSPTLIRVRGNDLKYSEAEHEAIIDGGPAGSVVAETGTATVVSNQLELLLLPSGNHAGLDGSAAQVDRVTASGHVTISSQGRRGTGDRLVYSGENDQYVLTGTPSNPPTLIDPAKGTVSGTSLIFNSRDDSVSIEGTGHKTSTETVAPK